MNAAMNAATGVLLMVSFLLGAVHVLSPDHWVPISLQSWQRDWSLKRTNQMTFQFFLLHVLAGLVLALLLQAWAVGLGERGLLFFSITGVVVFSAGRFLRFSKLKEAFLAGPESKRGILASWTLLGPAESLVPVVLKSVQSGQGYLLPVVVYFLGTWISGSLLVHLGRRLWRQPARLAQGYSWVNRLTWTRS
ncbi:MAG: hypothetical protein ACK5QT_05795 [Oligoflexia bacterium]